ncbi:MAG: sigma-70 family RNA polymerase sigma factor [Deltaproteobacteria bacterium]|nr:sigma-70 family RNA polymerase sigma factor [Deltaproteobacteria bacterium]
MTTALDSHVQDHLHNLYTGHHAWLVHWLRRKLGCPHNAADLAHDTFLRTLGARNLSDLREPRAYLTTTATRLLIDRARRDRIEQAYLAELALAAETAGHHSSPEEIHAAVAALERFCAVLADLSEKPRQAFLLHYLDGATHATIAVQLGVSTKMVQKYLVKALVHCHLALDA